MSSVDTVVEIGDIDESDCGSSVWGINVMAYWLLLRRPAMHKATHVVIAHRIFPEIARAPAYFATDTGDHEIVMQIAIGQQIRLKESSTTKFTQVTADGTPN